MVRETELTSEIFFPTDSLLAQLAEHGTDDLEVVGSIPGRDNFFILLFSFNAGRIWQEILNYAKTRLLHNLTRQLPLELSQTKDYEVQTQPLVWVSDPDLSLSESGNTSLIILILRFNNLEKM